MLTNKVIMWIALCCMALQCMLFEVNAGCVCNEKGTDYCEACSERRVVRPKHKYYDTSADLDLSPIGDNCWCSKLMIEPATLPKPCPKHKTPTCSCNSQPSYDSVPYSSYDTPLINYAPSYPKDDSLPADPISVSLAIQAGKAIEVPEAKLAYGYVQKPLDGLKKIYFSSVPEENLFKLKHDVITLKKRPQNSAKEEEEWMDVEEEEEGAADDDEQPHLTYKQLGYVTEQFKNPKFREVPSSYAIKENDYKSVPSKVSVDCGFKPGRVSAYRKIASRSDINNCFENV